MGMKTTTTTTTMMVVVQSIPLLIRNIPGPCRRGHWDLAPGLAWPGAYNTNPSTQAYT